MAILSGHPAVAHTPEFAAWKNMIYRCTDPYHKHWPRYGGAGIRVHESWTTFEVFRRDMGRRPAGHVLSRKDKRGDFAPDNCRWEPRRDAARRYRSTTTLTYQGETLLLAEWAERTGLPTERIRSRIVALGWTVGQALELEPRAGLAQKRGSSFCDLQA